MTDRLFEFAHASARLVAPGACFADSRHPEVRALGEWWARQATPRRPDADPVFRGGYAWREGLSVWAQYGPDDEEITSLYVEGGGGNAWQVTPAALAAGEALLAGARRAKVA